MRVRLRNSTKPFSTIAEEVREASILWRHRQQRRTQQNTCQLLNDVLGSYRGEQVCEELVVYDIILGLCRGIHLLRRTRCLNGRNDRPLQLR